MTTLPGQLVLPGSIAVTTSSVSSFSSYGTVKRTVVVPSRHLEADARIAGLAVAPDEELVVRALARLLRQAGDRQLHRPVAAGCDAAEADRGARVRCPRMRHDADDLAAARAEAGRRARSRRRGTRARVRRRRRSAPRPLGARAAAGREAAPRSVAASSSAGAGGSRSAAGSSGGGPAATSMLVHAARGAGAPRATGRRRRRGRRSSGVIRSSSSRIVASRWSALRVRVFTVPSGMSSLVATSLCERSLQ